jgi:glyoxylase-like metal-dependent hydrolase (beta-lactamase superfamily II)
MLPLRLALLLALAAPLPAAAQQDMPALADYRRARTILDAGIAAAGGEPALRALAGVRRELVERRIDIGQQQRPWTGPPDIARQPANDTVPISSFLDLARGRWARVQHFDDGPAALFTQVDGGDSGTTFSAGHYYDEPVFWASGPEGAAAALLRERRRYPEGLLLLALERAETLTHAGTAEADGRRFDIVAFSDPAGARTLLYFDAATRLLARAGGVRDHALLGDVGFETRFADYRRAGAILTPFAIEEWVAGYPTRAALVRSVDPAADAPDLLAAPARRIAVTATPDAPTIHDRGARVFEILGPYNVMFAVFDDHVLLAEAPSSAGYVEALLRLIEGVAPGKPIRAVASHFHYDHLGGVPALAARGIPILATADAAEIIRRTSASRRTIRPLAPARPAEVGVAGPVTRIADARQEVTIFHVGPGEHVADLLVTYFAGTRTLYVADLWDVPTAAQPIAGPDAELVMARAAALGLVVERMVPSHGVPIGRAEMENGLAIRRRHLEPNHAH